MILSLGKWKENPHLCAKALLNLGYGLSREVEAYSLRYQVSPIFDDRVLQADLREGLLAKQCGIWRVISAKPTKGKI